jgi:hypothetical protein
MEHKVKAEGIRRREVDLEKLALAYYFVARSIVAKAATTANESAADERTDVEKAA